MATHTHTHPSILVATDVCRRAGHRLAETPQGIHNDGSVICVTCTEMWGKQKGLREWQENCPCCFSAAHPNGLTDLGISAALQSIPD